MASGNPLLNLQNALGASPSSTQDTGFTVKRRWDDDLIFKNQALNTSDKPKKEFVNDLLRTDCEYRVFSILTKLKIYPSPSQIHVQIY